MDVSTERLPLLKAPIWSLPDTQTALPSSQAALLLSVPALAAPASTLQHTADHELEARLARYAIHTFACTLLLSLHETVPASVHSLLGVQGMHAPMGNTSV